MFTVCVRHTELTQDVFIKTWKYYSVKTQRYTNETYNIIKELEAQSAINGDVCQILNNMKTEITKLQIATCTQAATTTPFLQSCDKGWKHFNGHCYLVVEEEKTWDDASEYCENINSYLTEITTDTERDFGHELMVGYAMFWTGATDRDIEGRFVYQHCKQHVPEKYWRAGQPDDSGGQHCALMGRYYGGLEFLDGRCNWKTYFACEKP